jgi:polar amino acid transport system substrate-binding protein
MWPRSNRPPREDGEEPTNSRVRRMETIMDQAAMKQVVAELAPTGVLRAAINLGNPLLVTGRSANGDPSGVAPDMAAEVASRLGVALHYVTYPRAGELADAGGTGAWDIGLIGAEPARAQTIAFTAAYSEIEATYLVPAGSSLKAIADVDRPGIRISSANASAYDLWLERNIKHAELVKAVGLDGSFKRFVDDKLDALSGLRPQLLADLKKLSGARILEGNFTTVQQAIGTVRGNRAGADFLDGFVEEAKRSGLVARLIAKHGVAGLSVAPPKS